MGPKGTQIQYKDQSLYIESVSLKEITKRVGSPCFVYSRAAFTKPLEKLKAGLKELETLICFAVKSNSNLTVLKTLDQAGAGMDIVSGGELFRLGKAGVSGSKIVFSGVGKTTQEINEAFDYDGGKGIFSFNVESIEELKRIDEIATQKKKRARASFRFNPDVNPQTHPYISTGLRENKFGISERDLLDAASSFADFKSIDFRGVSSHIGSLVNSITPYEASFAKMSQMLDKLNSILPHPIEYVDLGGGMGIPYREGDPEFPIDEYTKLIQKEFGHRKGLKILIEPGRIISGNSGVLLTEILYRKSNGEKEFIVVDASMTELIRPALYQSHHEIIPLQEPAADATLQKADIVGPVCESTDFLMKEGIFPKDLKSGDQLAILSAGAYGFTLASHYNSRPNVAEVWVDGSEYKVIRKRETYEDLIRGET